MEKLSPYQTHKLIKQAVPEAITVYEKENDRQIQMVEWVGTKFAEEEATLKEEDPELFEKFLYNIERKWAYVK